MCKRLCLLTSFVLLLVGVPVFGDVGIFDFTGDIGDVGGYGATYTVPGSGQYEIIASGSDIQSTADQFHYAYNQVSGNVRFALHPMWEVAPNHWSKIEAMLRVNNSPGSQTYGTVTRRGGVNTSEAALSPVDSFVCFEFRATQDGGTSGGATWDGDETPSSIAIQRVVSNGYQLVQSLVDYGSGSGWQAVDTRLVSSLPDALLLGVGVTSHHNQGLARAVISDVAYMQNPDLVGITRIDGPLPEVCSDIPGFLVKVAQNPDGTTWPGDYAANYAGAEDLVKTGLTPDGEAPKQMGQGIREYINLHDSGGRFNFDNDASFPGIDGFEQPTSDPADGDEENQFAAVITACIELDAGLHIIGGHADDGILVRIGGVEIGRVGTWNSTDDWMFEVATAGVYDLEAIVFEGTGGADAELMYRLPTGELVRLGDTDAGSPAVYVPEPATIALLGFGGLSLLRIRRKR